MGSDSRTRAVYVTARLPFGDGEPFIVPEVLQLAAGGCAVTLVPVRTGGTIADGDARQLLGRTEAVPLLSGGVLWSAAREAVRAPARAGRALLLLRRSRSVRILLKNLGVFPKALWLARHVRETGADHIHAHWASTSATLAMLAGETSGVPWSLTAHRWDIAENNLLREKARRACFVRVVSAHGANELRAIVADAGWSPWVLYMGVRLPPSVRVDRRPGDPLRVLTAARFVEKKGHLHLLEALALVRGRGADVRVDLAGEGPLEPVLRKRVSDLDLEGAVAFLGRVAHDDLLAAMGDGRWDAMALPSVVTPSGELEGIPVALIEAMACGLPVVGTDAGGVPELLADGAGLLVPPADAQALADALELLARDPAARIALAERGRRRVEGAFSVERVAAELHARFRECGARRG